MNHAELESIIQRLRLLYEQNHALHQELAAERKRADAAAQFLRVIAETPGLPRDTHKLANEIAYQIQLRKPE